MKIKFIDLFCGGGSVSIQFKKNFPNSEIVGVDTVYRNYPFDFIKADAHTIDLSYFNFVWASPPCQRYSKVTPKNLRNNYPDYIPTIREHIKKFKLPYIIENVPSSPLINPIKLNGFMFGQKYYLLRWFETPIYMLTPKLSRNDFRADFNQIHTNGHKELLKRAGFDRGSKWLAKNSIPTDYTNFLFENVKIYFQSFIDSLVE